jgi:hypothetical protein
MGAQPPRPGDVSGPPSTDAASGVEHEAAYYQAVEEFFVSRRGDPLFLSNADWLLIREWRVAGIPLRVVLRGIGDALDAHAHSFSRDRKVGSLRYCAAEVEAARDRWERALAGGFEETHDIGATLDRLEAAFAGARDLGRESSVVLGRILDEMRRRRGSSDSPRAWEEWLAASERSLLAALEREGGPEVLARLDADIELELAPYRRRMPERVARQIHDDARARRVLEAHGLPRLSLFQA